MVLTRFSAFSKTGILLCKIISNVYVIFNRVDLDFSENFVTEIK